MSEFKISIDLSDLGRLRGIIDAQILPLLAQAVRAVALQTQANWIELIGRAKLAPYEKKLYGSLVQSKETGPFSWLVWTDYRYAQEIDNGRPARDLKRMLDTSAKVRRTKDGRRFLIIPMRHNTPGEDATSPSMPSSIYALAQNLKQSSISGSRMSATGALTSLHPKWGMRELKKQTPFASVPGSKMPLMTTRNTYTWGEKLQTQHLIPQMQARYAGMVRMKEAGGNSTYVTFRVMMEGSKGWIVPPQPGQHIVKRVVDDMTPVAEKIFQEAIRRSF